MLEQSWEVLHDQDTKPLSSALWSYTSCLVASTGRQAWHEPFTLTLAPMVVPPIVEGQPLRVKI
eukprot:3197978-Amphidinium_carterae.2